MTSIRVSLVQVASTLDPVENRAALADLVPSGSDLVVLPEAYARDFGAAGSDVSTDAEPTDGPFAARLVELAAERGSTVVAGMFEQSPDPERPWNTLLLARPAGPPATYRKIHLYDSFGYRESDRLSAGPINPTVTEVAGVRVGLMTCYDLRFPELARRLVDQGAELIVLPAAWVAGERKVDHWRTLLRARAIENTVYVAAAAQPAPRYCGHSMLVDPLGDVLVEAGDGPQTISGTVNLDILAQVRRTNPSLANRRL